MWVALFIIGIITWLFNRKKKTVKSNKRLLLLILISFALILRSIAQDGRVTISGEIINSQYDRGEIIIFLVDRTTFETPLSGVDTVAVKPLREKVQFRFKPQEKGNYAIRCFHDINSNNRLDKRMFLPIEPYGFSWNTKKKFPVDFDDISFTASSDKFIKIKIN